MVEQVGLLAHRHQGADIVEQVDEQEDEHDLDEADAQRAGDIQLAPRWPSDRPDGSVCGVHFATPVASPTAVVARIPISMAARTRQASSAAVSSSPKSASAVLGSVRLPSVTVVAGFGHDDARNCGTR